MFDETLIPRFGLYIHWPFCAAKCPYCDFNSHVQSGIDHARWEKAMRAEIRRLAAETQGRVLGTVFFGGGTPSLMPPALVAALLDEAHRGWSWANDIEITLEANPTSIEMSHFADLRTAGVNRVSMGVQALNDADLKRLGRMHSTAEALTALEIAQKNFERVSIDLIYARQEQGRTAWEDELSHALSLGLQHLSLYQLTIEPGTVFAKQFERGRLKGLPDEDLAVDLWDITQSLTEKAGLHAYEISNHAAEGHESRHNMIYWTGGDWAALGPGAHGRLTHDGTRFAFECAKLPELWLERVESRGHGEIRRDALSIQDSIDERVLMGLRVREGIDLNRLISDGWAAPESEIRDLEAAALVQTNKGRLHVTEAGRPLLNAIVARLLT